MARLVFLDRPWWRDRLGAAQLHLLFRAVLLAILATLVARLAWLIVTPVGALGDWQPPAPRSPAPALRSALLGSVDPFGSDTPGVTQANVVTSLDLELFGVRQNLGAGTGSAIIGTPDGQQLSIGVGEEIMPGATLYAVAFDHVVIDRGGIQERLYLDESEPADVVGPSGQAAGLPTVSAPTPPSAATEAIRFTPRMRGGSVTGIAVGPGSNRALWDQSGLRASDVIVAVNGVDVTSSTDLEQLRREVRPGARINVMVERGSNRVPVIVTIPQ